MTKLANVLYLFQQYCIWKCWLVYVLTSQSVCAFLHGSCHPLSCLSLLKKTHLTTRLLHREAAMGWIGDWKVTKIILINMITFLLFLIFSYSLVFSLTHSHFNSIVSFFSFYPTFSFSATKLLLSLTVSVFSRSFLQFETFPLPLLLVFSQYFSPFLVFSHFFSLLLTPFLIFCYSFCAFSILLARNTFTDIFQLLTNKNNRNL